MQSKDGEDHEDKKPFDTRKRDVPMEDISNDDIVESDVEFDNSDIVEPDNDPPQKVSSSKNSDFILSDLSLLHDCLLYYYRWGTLPLK